MNKTVIAVALIVSAGGYFTYTQNQPVGPKGKEETRHHVMQDPQDQQQKLSQVTQPSPSTNQIITEGERSYAKGALPPGGETFIKDVQQLEQEIEQALTGEPQLPHSDAELEKLIAETDKLIAEVDKKEGLKTQEFLDKMLNNPSPVTDPELAELEDKSQQLDQDVQKIIQSMQ